MSSSPKRGRPGKPGKARKPGKFAKPRQLEATGESSDDSKGGSRWAPIVVFGGILAIGATSVIIVLASHCGRDQPYLDPVRVPFDPTNVPPKPDPVRAKGI